MKEDVPEMFQKILAYFRREVVFTVALVCALASFLLVPPGMHTLQGIDITTLLMLFSLMTVVAGLRRCGLFDRLSLWLAGKVSTLRSLCRVLTVACFVLAMIATNDVALLTMVPFTLLLMKKSDSRSLLLTVVLETIAANLGSMLTPIGNPQNLYLYSTGLLGGLDFLRLTWPYALLSLVLLMALGALVSRESVSAEAGTTVGLPQKQVVLYAVLSIAALLGVAKLLPVWIMALIVLIGTLLFDREVLKNVDFPLLGTFVCFFVFVATIKAYAPIRSWLEGLMAISPMAVSLLSSQVISNVPACLLLSPFTDNAAALMLGVNLGGLGTLVASLASLISFKLYGQAKDAKKGAYFAWFTGLNLLFLVILAALAKVLGAW